MCTVNTVNDPFVEPTIGEILAEQHDLMGLNHEGPSQDFFAKQPAAIMSLYQSELPDFQPGGRSGSTFLLGLNDEVLSDSPNEKYWGSQSEYESLCTQREGTDQFNSEDKLAEEFALLGLNHNLPSAILPGQRVLMGLDDDDPLDILADQDGDIQSDNESLYTDGENEVEMYEENPDFFPSPTSETKEQCSSVLCEKEEDPKSNQNDGNTASPPSVMSFVAIRSLSTSTNVPSENRIYPRNLSSDFGVMNDNNSVDNAEFETNFILGECGNNVDTIPIHYAQDFNLQNTEGGKHKDPDIFVFTAGCFNEAKECMDNDLESLEEYLEHRVARACGHEDSKDLLYQIYHLMDDESSHYSLLDWTSYQDCEVQQNDAKKTNKAIENNIAESNHQVIELELKLQQCVLRIKEMVHIGACVNTQGHLHGDSDHFSINDINDENVNTPVNEKALDMMSESATKIQELHVQQTMASAEIVELRSKLLETQTLVDDLEHEKYFNAAKVGELLEILAINDEQGARAHMTAKAIEMSVLTVEVEQLRIALKQRDEKLERLRQERDATRSVVVELSDVLRMVVEISDSKYDKEYAELFKDGEVLNRDQALELTVRSLIKKVATLKEEKTKFQATMKSLKDAMLALTQENEAQLVKIEALEAHYCMINRRGDIMDMRNVSLRDSGPLALQKTNFQKETVSGPIRERIRKFRSLSFSKPRGTNATKEQKGEENAAFIKVELDSSTGTDQSLRRLMKHSHSSVTSLR